LSSPFPDLKLWSFWAAKEAAYKAISKAFPNIPSIPRLFPVYMDDDASADDHSRETGKSPFPLLNKGLVLTPEGKCWIQVDYRHTYIHCLAFTDVPENLIFSWRAHYLFSCRQKVSSQESEAVRLALRFHLARFLDEKFKDLEISRQKNGASLAPPRVFSRGRPLDVDISLSHDGIFVAHACMEQQNA
jgi:phosphopantetheinyl transferase (holo-ACP synthase)